MSHIPEMSQPATFASSPRLFMIPMLLIIAALLGGLWKGSNLGLEKPLPSGVAEYAHDRRLEEFAASPSKQAQAQEAASFSFRILDDSNPCNDNPTRSWILDIPMKRDDFLLY